MVSTSSVRTCILAGMLSGLLIGCGAKRSNKFSGSCSSLKAVADLGPGAPKTLRAGESYDPSSVLLHFRAKSDKISIESRCNARLVHTLSVKNAATPVDFGKVSFQLSSPNAKALELHTSAHCFFRVWDPRDKRQLAHNPELAADDVRKVLEDDKERYHLYKSLLASPQKLFAFSESGEPIEFEYKLKNATGIYAQFFEQIERLNESSRQRAQGDVGREFSRTSILLDELALDVCSAGHNREDGFIGVLSDPNLSEAEKLYALKKGGIFSSDAIKRMAVSFGKHKVCLSQSDLVVAPIVLTGEPSTKQANHLNTLHTHQRKKLEAFESNWKKSTSVEPPAGYENRADRFISEFNRGTRPTSSLAATCSWSSSYPALSITHPVFHGFGSAMDSWDEVKEPLALAIFDEMRQRIPAVAPLTRYLESDLGGLLSDINREINETSCEMKGGSFLKGETPADDKCLPRTAENTKKEPEYGACPPGDPSDPDGRFTKEATRIHLNVNASLRLATVSMLRSLESYRAASDEILLLPLASLRGVAESETLSELKATLDQLNQDDLIGLRELVVEKVDDETIPTCSLRREKSALALGETPFNLNGDSFRFLSREARTTLKSVLSKSTIENAYSNFEVRYLKTRCIGAATQVLYNTWTGIPGLLQMLHFSDLSMIAAGAPPSNGRASPTSQELLETGRAVSVRLPSAILGHEFASTAFMQETAAKLLGSGHLQVGECIATERNKLLEPDTSGDLQPYLQRKKERRDYFCEATPANDRYLERVRVNKAYYQSGEEFKKVFEDLDGYDSAYGVYPSSLIESKMSTKAVADALPRMFGHLNFITAVPQWLPPNEKAKYPKDFNYIKTFESKSGRYFLTAGDSGTTVSVFGLFPMFMLSTVQDVPVSGGISVVPSTSGQDVQSGSGSNCR